MKASVLSVNSVVKFLWAAALVTLPVTSFRWFPFLGDSTLVRPMALYPLALLLPTPVLRNMASTRPPATTPRLPTLVAPKLPTVIPAPLPVMLRRDPAPVTSRSSDPELEARAGSEPGHS